jgi:2-isopropylmalate synthase
MVKILDTTLREGEQSPGLYFDGHIKLAIARMLDEIGVDIVEAGHPVVTSEIKDAVRLIAASGLNALVGAHARSLRKDIDLALECGVGFIGIFYCVSDQRLTTVFNKNLDQAVEQITDVIRYAKSQKPDLVVRYTPEDTVRSPWENVVKASVAAVQAGADVISVADTTGYMIPGTKRSMYDFVKNLKAEFTSRGLKPMVAVHCHNDRGLALANALDGFRGGADIIDVTVMGVGERAGLVDLATLLAVLKTDFSAENPWKLEKLPELYRTVSRYSGMAIPINYPVMGQNAFTHCAGVHTQAAAVDPLHYESLNPSMIGRQREIALDHMSGISSIKAALSRIGENTDNEPFMMKILDRVKSVGTKGKTVDLAELRHIVEWCNEHENEGK